MIDLYFVWRLMHEGDPTIPKKWIKKMRKVHPVFVHIYLKKLEYEHNRYAGMANNREE